MHVVSALAPAVTEYVPETQLVHVDSAPPVTEYLPATQFIHKVELFAPTMSEYLPATQLMHTVAFAAEYDPARQAVHITESEEYVPDTQFVQRVDCHCEFVDVPAWQNVHVVDLYVCVYFPG